MICEIEQCSICLDTLVTFIFRCEQGSLTVQEVQMVDLSHHVLFNKYINTIMDSGLIFKK